MMRAYLRAALRAASSDLAPVTTILPLRKMSAVVFGSRMRMITAAKRFGLYSALRACSAIVFRSSSTARLHVATMFCSVGLMPDGFSDGFHAMAAVEEPASAEDEASPAPSAEVPASASASAMERVGLLPGAARASERVGHHWGVP